MKTYEVATSGTAYDGTVVATRYTVQAFDELDAENRARLLFDHFNGNGRSWIMRTYVHEGGDPVKYASPRADVIANSPDYDHASRKRAKREGLLV